MKSTRSCAPLNASVSQTAVEQAGEAFRALRRAIARGRGFSLYTAICDSPTTRDALIANLGASMPSIVLTRVALGIEDDDILDAVERAIKEAPAAAVMVVGIEQHLANQAQAERLLAGLNLGRPEWPARIRATVVFWVPRRFLGRLTRGAPDFFDWRSDTLDFPELSTVQARTFASREWEYGPDPRFTADERRERNAELRARIAGSASSDHAQVVRSALSWWDELADHYELIGETDEALRIRREEELPVYERLGDVAHW